MERLASFGVVQVCFGGKLDSIEEKMTERDLRMWPTEPESLLLKAAASVPLAATLVQSLAKGLKAIAIVRRKLQTAVAGTLKAKRWSHGTCDAS